MEEHRLNPDDLLAQVQAQEAKAKSNRGKLKIFFGAAAGVGKTFAMLTGGRSKFTEGVDVVVGYAEPHARPETEALLLGMEIMQYKFVEYRGAQLKELDVDAVLKRKPELVLVDELAHTNAPGMRHAKRWQDVHEILDAGIDVYTSLNVQHLESLNDVVAQITGVIVRETLPDEVFDGADEVELIDIPPDDLLERFGEGKIYMPGQAERAMSSFFRKANLTALRELALRRTADRVNAQVQSERLEQFAKQTWPTAERILVCVTPSPSSARVVRSAKRMAVALHAEWIAAYVETPKLQRLSPSARERLLNNFQLAERIGAETVTLSGMSMVDEIVNYARSRNVTKIVIGKPNRPLLIELALGSVVDELIRKSGEIDVFVIRGSAKDEDPREKERWSVAPEIPVDFTPFLNAFGVIAVSSLVCFGMDRAFSFEPANLSMVYLLGIAVVAANYGRIASVIASILSVLVFDFFFVPPKYTFVMAPQYFMTFGIMLAIGLLIGHLTARVREQADASRQRERRTEALYRMTGQLAATTGVANLLNLTLNHLADVFRARAVFLTPDETGRLAVRATHPNAFRDGEMGVAEWAYSHQQVAGRGTDTLPSSESLYIPLNGSKGIIGVVGLQTDETHLLLAPEQRQLLDAFVNQIALAIEREQLSLAARQSQVKAETEQLRSSLLSSVSHDLRTPLAVITGASGSLLEQEMLKRPDHAMLRETIQTIGDESERLARLVANLLDITRIESGAVTPNRQWQPLEEVIGSALHHVRKAVGSRPVNVNLPADLPLVNIDGVLLDQVFVNLIENVTRYTLPGTPIDIQATRDSSSIVVDVADRGPGLSPGEEERVFEKFYRGKAGSVSGRGTGLGLSICRAIVEAHGGKIWAQNRAPDAQGRTGASFKFSLPIEGTPPTVPSFSPEPEPANH